MKNDIRAKLDALAEIHRPEEQVAHYEDLVTRIAAAEDSVRQKRAEKTRYELTHFWEGKEPEELQKIKKAIQNKETEIKDLKRELEILVFNNTKEVDPMVSQLQAEIWESVAEEAVEPLIVARDILAKGKENLQETHAFLIRYDLQHEGQNSLTVSYDLGPYNELINNLDRMIKKLKHQ